MVYATKTQFVRLFKHSLQRERSNTSEKIPDYRSYSATVTERLSMVLQEVRPTDVSLQFLGDGVGGGGGGVIRMTENVTGFLSWCSILNLSRTSVIKHNNPE